MVIVEFQEGINFIFLFTDILQLADFYNLPNLLEETALVLSRGLNVDNALSIYRGADLYNALVSFLLKYFSLKIEIQLYNYFYFF